MHGEFIIVKLSPLISDRTDQIKSTPPREFFALQGCVPTTTPSKAQNLFN
jgi:hypothetical protein